MPPKFDPAGASVVYIRSIGGEVCAVSTLAPKIGPLGLSPKKIGEQLCAATREWEGLRVVCKLTVRNRVAEVEPTPSASAMLIKFLREPRRDRKKEKGLRHDGDLPMADAVSVAKMMRARSLSVTLLGGLKEVLGTAASIGCRVDGVPAKSCRP